MSAASPVNLANLSVPPAPGNRDPGGGQLFSYGGQPYWLDSQGNLWALTTTGTSASWSQAAFTGGGGGGFSLTRAAVQTGNFTAAANTIVPCDTTGGSLTVTLPNAPAANTLVIVKMVTQGGTNTVTVNCAGADVFNKAGGGTSGTLKLSSQGMFLDYNGAGIWTVLADDLPLSQLDLRYLNLAGGGAVAGSLSTTPSVLTDASTILVNAALSDVFRVTLGGNRTLGSPSNPADGQAITFEVIQDATGSRTLAYGGAYSFPASIGTPVLSSTPAFHDFLAFCYDATATTWYCTGFVPQAVNATPYTVAQGGTGDSSLTAYALLAGGTTSTGAVQQVAALGSSGQVLTSNGAAALPTFQPSASGFSNPMTTLGDLIYENATPAAARLAGQTTATKNFLTQTGTGSVSAAPAWGAIAAGDLPTGTTGAKGALQLDGTASDITQTGTASGAGAVGLAADSGHTHASAGWVPADNALLLAAFDPAAACTAVPAVAGTVYLVKLYVRVPTTLTYVWWACEAVGSGASTTSFTGVYNSSGTLLSGSSDIGAQFTTTGAKQCTLTTPQSLAAGTFVWVAVLFNLATTQPTLAKGAQLASYANAGLTAATYRFPSYPTLTQTALPGSFTPSSNNSGIPYWAGGS